MQIPEQILQRLPFRNMLLLILKFFQPFLSNLIFLPVLLLHCLAVFLVLLLNESDSAFGLFLERLVFEFHFIDCVFNFVPLLLYLVEGDHFEWVSNLQAHTSEERRMTLISSLG